MRLLRILVTYNKFSAYKVFYKHFSKQAAQDDEYGDVKLCAINCQLLSGTKKNNVFVDNANNIHSSITTDKN